jgi:hypothetical protein
MPLTAGQLVRAIDADHIESVAAATALVSLGLTATAAELNYVDNVTSAIQTQLDAKAPLASPTFTGTVAGITAAMVSAAPATPSVNAQIGTTYSLQASDNGKIVTCSNGSPIDVTVPSGLGAGFHCQVIQIGAGQVSFVASGTTVNNRQSHTKIAGQYGVAGLSAYASNVFALAGDTAS